MFKLQLLTPLSKASFFTMTEREVDGHGFKNGLKTYSPGGVNRMHRESFVLSFQRQKKRKFFLS